MKLSMKPHFNNKGQPEAGSRVWYKVRNEVNNEIFIYDEIGRGWLGGGVSAEDFVKDVQAMNLTSDDELRLRINSPGGDLFDGNTIYNYLRASPFKVSVHIDGVAASAASIVAMAGDTVSMPENSFLMIHNPWMVVAGDAQVMRKVADDLDVLREGAVSTYMSRVNLTREEVVTMLDEETWLSANDSVGYGFADVIDDPVRAAALLKFDLADYGLHAIPDPILNAKDSVKQQKMAMREKLVMAKKTMEI